MSKLAPISFPEDKHAVATPSSGFPYAAIDGGQPQSDQNTGYGANRMQSDHMQSDRMQPNRMQPNRMQQLEAMLHEAQGRAEIIEKEAYDKAYLAGEKAGMALGKKRGEQLLGSLQESLQDATDELTAMRQSFAEAAMDVAGFIASQILTDALDSDHSRLWEIARQAATCLPDVSGLHIAVSPDDYDLFKRLLEAESSMAVLSSDATIASGSCRIISSQQDMLIDPVGAVQNCLEQLRPALIQERNANAPAGDSDGG